MIKYLMDEVKKNRDKYPFDKATDIPLDDKEVYKMFSETKIIGVKDEDILSELLHMVFRIWNTIYKRNVKWNKT